MRTCRSRAWRGRAAWIRLASALFWTHVAKAVNSDSSVSRGSTYSCSTSLSTRYSALRSLCRLRNRLENHMRIAFSVALGVALLAPSVGAAQATDTTIKVTYGGFVDSYYAYDFGRPRTFDRSFAGGAIFTTQPARHDEFNVNLAYIEASFSGSHVHGRLAFQAGTSVQSNYFAEP